MVSRVSLVGILLAVPLIGFFVAMGIQDHLNSELRAALNKKFPNADRVEISRMTVDRLCEKPVPALRKLCRINRNLALMKAGALGAGAVGLLLLLAIRLAGSVARNNRNLLLYLFKPGLYLTAIILIGLIVIHAALAVAAIYYGESVFVGRIHVGIIIAIVFGALAGIGVMAQSAFSLVTKAHTVVMGTNLARNEAPILWNQVESTADQLAALKPAHIVVGLDPNFFVTEADVTCLNGELSGRTLYCSLPLARILSRREFLSVIGHELGHFKGLDTKFSERFYPIYRGTASAIASLQETGLSGYKSIALLPAIAVLSYFFECFSVAESRISRERELAADKEGASVSDPSTFASVLVKIHAFSRLWDTLQYAVANALQEGKAFVNASKTYAEIVAKTANLKALEGIAESHLSHPTDSHPPLSVRLQALGVTLEDVSETSLAVSPLEPAISLISDAEQKEKFISGAYQTILARRLGIDLNALADGKGV